MAVYKLIVAYDGTDYKGWQQQKKGQKTISGALRDTFCLIFHQKYVSVTGASRTDAGVHAHGQVVRIITELNLAPEKLLYALNRALPEGICVRSCQKVHENFHPQHQVFLKIYTYRFFLEQQLPCYDRYGYYIRRKFNLQACKQALAVFVGTHDFKLFCSEETDRSTVKTINEIIITPGKLSGEYVVIIKGQSFLRYMIRRIIGAAFALAIDSVRSSEELKALLADTSLVAKNLPVAPAKGLCLEEIEYTHEYNLK